jgi:sulfhydrogenase subunit beta (sulfur reductase)
MATMSKIRKEDLRAIFDILGEGHTVIGQKVRNDTIVLEEIAYADIPAGVRVFEAAGKYRLEEQKDGNVFTFPPGPDSLKKFLHPASEELFTFRKSARNITVRNVAVGKQPLAFVGARACDIAAVRLLDKIFLEGPVRDQGYERRRRSAFIAAVNCALPGGNCFCDSMGTGPEATEGFDLAITELSGSFLVEAGSAEGEQVLDRLPREEAQEGDREEKRNVMARCRAMMQKTMKTGDLPGILYRNMEHPRWAEIAARDLECGNCTMVCPTCFCTSSFDAVPVSAVAGVQREWSGLKKRSWDSCFSKNFARVHGGNFRQSRRARYRHWMTHKLAYWIDQFGRPGCVGCGRCITWCPVGIDITRELEELRHVR